MTLCISSLPPAMAAQESLHVKTPLRDSMALSKLAGTSVFLKMDSSQPSGSFKIRGIGHLCKMVQGRVASWQEEQSLLPDSCRGRCADRHPGFQTESGR